MDKKRSYMYTARNTERNKEREQRDVQGGYDLEAYLNIWVSFAQKNPSQMGLLFKRERPGNSGSVSLLATPQEDVTEMGDMDEIQRGRSKTG